MVAGTWPSWQPRWFLTITPSSPALVCFSRCLVAQTFVSTERRRVLTKAGLTDPFHCPPRVAAVAPHIQLEP